MRRSANNLRVFLYYKDRNCCAKRPVSVYNVLDSFTMQTTSNSLDSNSRVWRNCLYVRTQNFTLKSRTIWSRLSMSVFTVVLFSTWTVLAMKPATCFVVTCSCTWCIKWIHNDRQCISSPKTLNSVPFSFVGSVTPDTATRIEIMHLLLFGDLRICGIFMQRLMVAS